MVLLAIETVDLQRVYRRGTEAVYALRGVDLAIPAGSFVALKGRSGSGKTTLLNCISGLDQPTGGAARIFGEQIAQWSEARRTTWRRRQVGFIFQSLGLLPVLSAYENVELVLRLNGAPARTRHKTAVEALELVGLGKWIDHRPYELSGGQQQRVAVGRAIVRRPRVFLFDEPLSNLDTRMRAQLRTEIIRLHQRLQTTILYVTHDQSEAMTMGSRIAVLRDGTLQQYGAPLDLYRQPVNTFVAGFLGSPPMNFVRGNLVTGDSSRAAFRESGGGSLEVEVEPGGLLAGGSRRDVLLGLRPEDLQPLHPDESPDAATFPALLDIVESTGAESICYLQTGANSIVCRSRTPVDPREIGHRLLFRVATSRLVFFDPDSLGRIA